MVTPSVKHQSKCLLPFVDLGGEKGMTAKGGYWGGGGKGRDVHKVTER